MESIRFSIGSFFVPQAPLLPFQALPPLLKALESSCPWVGASLPPGEGKILHLILVNSIKTAPCSLKLPAELIRGEAQRKTYKKNHKKKEKISRGKEMLNGKKGVNESQKHQLEKC